jgi:predicted ATPase
MKKILITGGPGTGKTSLVNELKNNEYLCSEEIVRDLTINKRDEGVDQYFLTDPLGFSIKLFNLRLKEYNKSFNSNLIIYDRGPIDVLAYLNFKSIEIPKDLINDSKKINYEYSFILNPWRDIYTQDSVRYESYEECVLIHEFLIKEYEKFKIKLIVVPNGTIIERVRFIKKFID